MPISRWLGCFVLLLGAWTASSVASSSAVKAMRNGETLTLSNDAVAATWSARGGVLSLQSLTNRFTGSTLLLNSSVFELVPKEGPLLRSADFKITGQPVIEDVADTPDSSRAGDYLPGKQIRIELQDSSGQLHFIWRAMLRESANYVAQEVTIHAVRQPLALAHIVSSMQSFRARPSPAIRRVHPSQPERGSPDSSIHCPNAECAAITPPAGSIANFPSRPDKA